MKRMLHTRAMLLLVLFLAASAAGFAQPGDRAARMLERMKKELTLTDEQSKKAEAILTAERDQAMKDRETYQGDREAMMKAGGERRAQTEKELEAVLTKAQMTKYRAMMEEMRNQFRGGMRGPGGNN